MNHVYDDIVLLAEIQQFIINVSGDPNKYSFYFKF